jgi:hypothetical protein
MKKQKLYFQRHYDQWKGLDIAIEEEVDGYGLYIQIPDTNMEDGSVTAISADFEGVGSIACSVADEKKRIIRVEVPKVILANDGLYKVSFSITYNSKGEESKIEKTAIQTFTILDTIEFSEEEIIADDRYSLLSELLNKVQEEELDVSIFAKKEYVEKLIEEALNGVDMDTIIAELEARGIYITSEELEERIGRLINDFDSSTGFLRKSKLVSELLRLEYINKEILDERMKNYTTTTKLESNYVKKENGKELISTILIDKLKNIPEKGYYDDTELRNLINKRVTHEYFKETIDNLNTIKKEDYYDKTAINNYVDDIYDMHNNSISDLEEDITNIESNIDNIEENYLKKEDYQYADGIQTDDVMLNEKTLTEILTELTYKEIEIKKFNTTLISHLYEFREDKLTSITLQWELSRNPISQSINIYNGTISVDSREITITTNINTDTDITLTVVDEKGIEKKSIIPIKFVFPSYYGTYENTLSIDNIRSGNKIIMDNKNTTIDMNYTNSKIFFAYPKVFGELVDIKDNNGLSYFNDFIYNGTDYATGGTSYNVYMLDEKATCKNISYSLIFKKEEE